MSKPMDSWTLMNLALEKVGGSPIDVHEYTKAVLAVLEDEDFVVVIVPKEEST